MVNVATHNPVPDLQHLLTRMGAFGFPPVQVFGAIGTDTRHRPPSGPSLSHSVNE